MSFILWRRRSAIVDLSFVRRKFVKVDLLSVDEKIPKPENDPELKETKLDSEMSEFEPVRWAGPNMIAFRKHLLYQPKDKPAEYANEIHRRHEIAMTIGDDGKSRPRRSKSKEPTDDEIDLAAIMHHRRCGRGA
jgi:hypothetical protein